MQPCCRNNSSDLFVFENNLMYIHIMGRKKKPPTKLINFRVPEDRAEECKAACREAIEGVLSEQELKEVLSKEPLPADYDW